MTVIPREFPLVALLTGTQRAREGDREPLLPHRAQTTGSAFSNTDSASWLLNHVFHWLTLGLDASE